MSGTVQKVFCSSPPKKVPPSVDQVAKPTRALAPPPPSRRSSLRE
jgi:hypothetical protein